MDIASFEGVDGFQFLAQFKEDPPCASLYLSVFVTVAGTVTITTTYAYAISRTTLVPQILRF